MLVNYNKIWISYSDPSYYISVFFNTVARGGFKRPCFDQLHAHILDVFVQLIKTWPLIITPCTVVWWVEWNTIVYNSKLHFFGRNCMQVITAALFFSIFKKSFFSKIWRIRRCNWWSFFSKSFFASLFFVAFFIILGASFKGAAGCLYSISLYSRLNPIFFLQQNRPKFIYERGIFYQEQDQDWGVSGRMFFKLLQPTKDKNVSKWPACLWKTQIQTPKYELYDMIRIKKVNYITYFTHSHPLTWIFKQLWCPKQFWQNFYHKKKAGLLETFLSEAHFNRKAFTDVWNIKIRLLAIFHSNEFY